MLYLSGYLKRPVLDATNRNVGKLVDLIARLDSRYPPIVGIRISIEGKELIDLPWEELLSFETPQIILTHPMGAAARYSIGERDVLLARNVLDKQILDLDGRRLIRVQDIELFRVYDHLRLLGVDVSGSALLRRLRWNRLADRVASRFPPRSVAWGDVDLGSWRDPYIRLRVARSGLHRLRPADLAEIAATLPMTEVKDLFTGLEEDVAADMLEEMPERAQLRVLEALGPEEAAHLLDEMSPDDAADLLGHLSTEAAESLLAYMKPVDAKEVRVLLGYEEESAGGLMTTEVLTAQPDETIGELVARLREELADRDPIYQVYVVDKSRRLIGELTMADVLLANEDAPVRTVMRSDPISVRHGGEIDDVIEAFVKYNLIALPVQDDEGRLVGSVTVDDIVDLMAPDALRRDRRRFLGG